MKTLVTTQNPITPHDYTNSIATQVENGNVKLNQGVQLRYGEQCWRSSAEESQSFSRAFSLQQYRTMTTRSSLQRPKIPEVPNEKLSLEPAIPHRPLTSCGTVTIKAKRRSDSVISSYLNTLLVVPTSYPVLRR